jgi:hypothetical protein
MSDPRTNYDLPAKPPLPFRQLMVIVVVHVLLVGLWLMLPSSAITVALLAITILSAVFIGTALVLRSRELDEKPGRNPVTPPSLDT